jgi:hypothetical protein
MINNDIVMDIHIKGIDKIWGDSSTQAGNLRLSPRRGRSGFALPRTPPLDFENYVVVGLSRFLWESPLDFENYVVVGLSRFLWESPLDFENYVVVGLSRFLWESPFDFVNYVVVRLSRFLWEVLD